MWVIFLLKQLRIHLGGAPRHAEATRQQALGGNAIGHAFAHDVPYKIQVAQDIIRAAVLFVKHFLIGKDDFPNIFVVGLAQIE